MSVRSCLVLCAICIGIGLLMLALRPVDDPRIQVDFPSVSRSVVGGGTESPNPTRTGSEGKRGGETKKKCATVEEMGEVFKGGFWNESLRVRRIIQDHFTVNGTYFREILLFFAIFHIYKDGFSLCFVHSSSVWILGGVAYIEPVAYEIRLLPCTVHKWQSESFPVL